MGVAFFTAAFFGVAFLAGVVLAVVLVTRPDLVFPRTAGLSTTAGACWTISRELAGIGRPRLTALGAAAFFGFAAALGLAAFGFATLVALAFGAALALVAVVFLVAVAFFGLAAEGFLSFFSVLAAAGLGSFLASLVPPELPAEG